MIGVLGAAAVLGGAMAGIGLPAVPVEAAQAPSLVQATSKPSPRAGAGYLVGAAFNEPSAFGLEGTDLFVANLGGSITEVDASTGAIVRVISGLAYHFDEPKSLGLSGGDLFVANYAPGSGQLLRTERQRLGHRDRCIDGGAREGYLGQAVRLGGASGRDIDGGPPLCGGRHWAFSHRGQRLDRGAREGRLGPSYRFDEPGALALMGTDLFVANYGSAKITELDASTGALIKVISARSTS